jgi:hypothetical protein
MNRIGLESPLIRGIVKFLSPAPKPELFWPISQTQVRSRSQISIYQYLSKSSRTARITSSSSSFSSSSSTFGLENEKENEQEEDFWLRRCRAALYGGPLVCAAG